MHTFLSVLNWIWWTLLFHIFLILVAMTYLVTFPFDRFRMVPNRVLQGLAYCLFHTNPGWSVTREGMESYREGTPTLFVANHQSFLDMPLLYQLPWCMKFVAKKSMFKIPVLGWMMAMTGHIGIDRNSLRAVSQLKEVIDPLQAGVPVLLFPEGTRSGDGTIGRFKDGAFTIARQNNFLIQPIVLNGGYRAMPPGSWKFNFSQKFFLSVLEPVNPSDYGTVQELRQEVYGKMTERLEEIQRKK